MFGNFSFVTFPIQIRALGHFTDVWSTSSFILQVTKHYPSSAEIPLLCLAQVSANVANGGSDLCQQQKLVGFLFFETKAKIQDKIKTKKDLRKKAERKKNTKTNK